MIVPLAPALGKHTLLPSSGLLEAAAYHALMSILEGINDGLRLLLEFAALVSLGYWGFRTGQNLLTKRLLGFGVPLLTAVIWGVLVAPNAGSRLDDPLRLLLELLIFGTAASALLALGQRVLAGVFAAAVLLNIALMFALDQR